MQDSIEAKLKKLSERLLGIEKQLIEESSTLSQDDLISLNKEFSAIKSVETKMNGRINEHTLLLKVF